MENLSVIKKEMEDAFEVVPPNGKNCSIGTYDKGGKDGCVACDQTAAALEAPTCRLCNDGRIGSKTEFQKFMGWCGCRAFENVGGLFPAENKYISVMKSPADCNVEIACLPGQQRPCFPPDKRAWTEFVGVAPIALPILAVSVLSILAIYYYRRRAQVVPI